MVFEGKKIEEEPIEEIEGKNIDWYFMCQSLMHITFCLWVEWSYCLWKQCYVCLKLCCSRELELSTTWTTMHLSFSYMTTLGKMGENVRSIYLTSINGVNYVRDRPIGVYTLSCLIVCLSIVWMTRVWITKFWYERDNCLWVPLAILYPKLSSFVASMIFSHFPHPWSYLLSTFIPSFLYGCLSYRTSILVGWHC